MNINILSLLIWLPIFSGLLLLFYNRKIKYINLYNIFINALIFVFSVLLLKNFNHAIADFQFVENIQWIEYLNINYYLGVDAISILLILLNSIIFLIVAFYNST